MSIEPPIVEVVDTSVFLEYLRIPGCFDEETSREVVADFDRKKTVGIRVVVAYSSIVETGDHICRIDDGSSRRTAAESLSRALEACVRQDVPWMMHGHKMDNRFLEGILSGDGKGNNLVDCFTRKYLEMGDLGVLQEARLLKERYGKNRRVRIWTLDAQLMSVEF